MPINWACESLRIFDFCKLIFWGLFQKIYMSFSKLSFGAFFTNGKWSIWMVSRHSLCSKTNKGIKSQAIKKYNTLIPTWYMTWLKEHMTYFRDYKTMAFSILMRVWLILTYKIKYWNQSGILIINLVTINAKRHWKI